MFILPAIDLLEGKAVRLAQGDYAAVTVYNNDPVAQAQQFAQAGAEWLHVVDLEGARSGRPAAAALIEQIIAATGLKVEVGGGVREMQTLQRWIEAGASRVVIGTQLARDPAFARAAAARFGEAVVAGVDARDGEVAIEGWREGSGIAAEELVAELTGWGIRHLVYTDISRDGMQTGINAPAYARIARVAGFAVTASGGITSLDDLRALAALGDDVVEGAIAGRALYERAFTVEQAVGLLGGGGPLAADAASASTTDAAGPAPAPPERSA
ncbi:MAG: 1-(5-phosphoribosyl)-5-[(5-phosphoribosylamino)methylideneamino]imidazole-4-carboxamide isomerase [Coriobacteriales bacterium]|jgi:phosphoribosylformimino-5-aminoimidazole carboxamide ribotide isomerase|nr:1-(5-phosphoribosyl)-5-[(5-phosphoribosylamino)methylideneamino]imidazole-4-carboxamide isomerase [Coriobacteriales bacterium]